MTTGALEGVRVLDVGHGVTGPYAARLLGDLGADVLKLEKPGSGDFIRATGPRLDPANGMPASNDGPRGGVLFEALNWNKQSIELDVSLAESRAQLEELLHSADIVITSFRPARLLELELTPDALLDVNPRLSAVAVTNFGLTGPRADYAASDLVLSAASGIMAISGAQGLGPIKHGGSTSLYAAGLNAAYVALAGYWTARRTGAGVGIDLAIRDCLTSELVMNNAFHAFCGLVQGCPPESSDPFDGNPLETGRGFISLQTSARVPVSRFSRLFNDTTFEDSDYQDPQQRTARSAELRDVLDHHLRDWSASELFQQASSQGYLSGFVQEVDQLLTCPQLEHRSVLHRLDERSASGEKWALPAAVVSMSDSPTTVRRRAPRLGECDRTPWAPREATPSSSPAESMSERPGPLSGLRVLDLSTVFAVPYLGALLADFGAEVIKVESPVRLDQTRTDWGGYFDNDPGVTPWDRGATFQVVNRGKKSITLNLATHRGRAALRRLVASTDILLENFTPRVMKSWGATFGDLSQINPGLIMLSNTGYGATGPWSSFKAQGTTLEATMGLMGVTGYPDGVPMRAGQSTPDFYACWAGLMAIFAALISRDGCGRGQHIDLAMYQIGASMLTDELIEYQASGQVPGRRGASDRDALVSGVYRTSDENGWVAVSVATHQADRLRDIIAPHVDDDRVDTSESLDLLLEKWACQQSATDAERDLQAVGIAASKVMDAQDLVDDAQLIERSFYEPVAIRGLSSDRSVIGRPFSWTSCTTSVEIRRDAPRYGENNDQILGEVLGLGEYQRTVLQELGVVAESPQSARVARPMDVATLLESGLMRRVDKRAGAQP